MKTLHRAGICLLLIAAILCALCACAAPETPTEPPASLPGETHDPSESDAPTEPPSPDTSDVPVESTELPTENIQEPPVVYPQSADSYLEGSLYCESDNLCYGRITYTDLESGEQMIDNVFGFYFHLSLDYTYWLDWENAVADPAGLFSDATGRIRITHFERDWYIEFYDGANANYVYCPEYGLYVPFYGSLDTVELVNNEFRLFRTYMLTIDPLFYFEADSPEEAAQIYCDRRVEVFTSTAEHDVYGACKDVSISDVSIELLDEDGTSFWLYYTITATPLGDYTLFAGNVIENGDGSYSCKASAILVLDEATGLWCDEELIRFWSYT